MLHPQNSTDRQDKPRLVLVKNCLSDHFLICENLILWFDDKITSIFFFLFFFESLMFHRCPRAVLAPFFSCPFFTTQPFSVLPLLRICAKVLSFWIFKFPGKILSRCQSNLTVSRILILNESALPTFPLISWYEIRVFPWLSYRDRKTKWNYLKVAFSILVFSVNHMAKLNNKRPYHGRSDSSFEGSSRFTSVIVFLSHSLRVT